MKIMIASDIHGSAYWCERLLSAFEREGAEKLLLLGDLLYHGPRNDLPREYAPKRVIEMLNGIRERILCVRGNCDTEVDQMVLDFPVLADYCILFSAGRTVYATHGHVYNKDNLPKTEFDVLIYGHFHTGFIDNVNGKIIANTGSTSLPKNDTPNSYIILEDNCLYLKDLDGNIIKDVNL